MFTLKVAIGVLLCKNKITCSEFDTFAVSFFPKTSIPAPEQILETELSVELIRNCRSWKKFNWPGATYGTLDRQIGEMRINLHRIYTWYDSEEQAEILSILYAEDWSTPIP